ncbi:MAG: molybdenum cofactor biosynthesis protein B [Thermoplasmata archaeon]
MGIEEHKKHAHTTVNCAVITVSTSRTIDSDESGKSITNLLKNEGHHMVHHTLVKDDISEIRAALEDFLKNQNIQAIILNGGTGISKKDVTIEAIKPFLEKELTGFGELFRYLSYKEIGSPAILSRAMACVGKGKLIFCLPGSTNACKLAMEKLILPELGHMVYEFER